MKDRNNPSNSKRTTGSNIRWFVSIAILTFLPMIAAMAKADTNPDPAWVALGKTATVGTTGSDEDVTVTASTDNAPATYTVKTAKGLAWIAWVTNEGKTYSQTTTTSTEPNYDSFYPASAGFEGCTVELANDIPLIFPGNTAENTESWVPIGRTSYIFKGTFNGNNHTISNLTITKEYQSYNRIGLFGSIKGGSINDLTVTGTIQLSSYESTSSDKFIGGIVGFSAGNIKNCHNQCEIDYGSYEKESGTINAGGITGKINESGCSITNCSNQGKISGEKASYCYAGGIVGTVSNIEAISNCFNSGEIEVTATACTAGGIVGSNGQLISNCYSTGAVKAHVDDSNSENSCCAGGIAGINDENTITNCYSTGAVSATHSGKSTSSNSCCAGGIVGNSASVNSSTISNCLALNNNGSAAISATATNGVSTYIGRIVGKYYTYNADDNNGTVFSNNHASTLTTMPDNYTYDKATDKKDGADIYLEDNISAILNAGISGSATSPWAYTDDKLPTLNVWTEQTKPQQPSLEKTSYLAHLSNWVTYGQTANVGTSGTDVTVTSTANGVTYTAHTVKGLAWIAWVTNEGKKDSDDQGKNYPEKTGFEDCIVEIDNNIANDKLSLAKPADVDDNFETSWIPIGNYKSFKGTFNGNNKTITDLSITKEYSYIGLFGSIDGGSVKDLTVEGKIEITLVYSSRIGGIVGDFSGDGSIYNCHNKCSIKATYNDSNNSSATNIGGIVGYIESGSPKVTNCSNQGDISSTGNTRNVFGGIIGFNSSGIISNCFNTGKIEATSKLNSIAGGIAGINLNKISNCYSTGAITTTIEKVNDTSLAGGIAGNNQSSITNCYSTGEISLTINASSGLIIIGAGGITGSFNPNSATSIISNCLALNKSIKVSATGHPIYVGRVIGTNSSQPTLTGNYASTLTTMPAGYTYEKGADKKDGADIYLEGDLAAILDAGQAPSPWVYTNNYLPTLKNLPGQPSQSKTAYLANKKIDPDPGNLPDNDDYTPPVYYIVTIPAVEGATTDPVAGDYEVEAWDSFGFYLTLEPAYDQSAPVVTTDRGETLEPRSYDGKYIVKYVRSDVDIAIEGITANEPPVANAVLTAGTRLWTEQQTLCIHTDTAGQLHLFTLAGSLYRTIELAPGDTRQPVPSGIYIARLNGQAIKILVP